jgi:hypothetical protein
MAVLSPKEHARANARMIKSDGAGSGFLTPVAFERVAGFIREPVIQNASWREGGVQRVLITEAVPYEAVFVPEYVQREAILQMCEVWDLRLTKIYQGSWSRPSRRPGGSCGPDGIPLVEEAGIDELARAIRHGAITAVVVSHIGVIGAIRQTREEFYRILQCAVDAQSGNTPRGARLLVSDFIIPAPRLMTEREWVKRHELVWQRPIRDSLDNKLSCERCGRDLESLRGATDWAQCALGWGIETVLRGYGADPETVMQPMRDDEPDDEWATLQAEYRLAITSAWLGAHVQIFSKRVSGVLSKHLQRRHGVPVHLARLPVSIIVCPCTERSMLRGELSEMPADRIGRTTIALDDPTAVRFTNPEYPWDRLPRLVTASMRDDPGRVVAGNLQ